MTRHLAGKITGKTVLLIAFLVLSASRLSAGQEIDSVYGPLPVFELHSGFWINLHHRLYQEARQQSSNAQAVGAKPGRSGKPPLQVARGATPPVTVAEQRAWDDAVSYYAANYADKDLLFSAELVLLKNQLGDFETCDELSGAKKKKGGAGA